MDAKRRKRKSCLLFKSIKRKQFKYFIAIQANEKLKLKEKLAKLCSRFQDFDQQDSREFLSYLLDGMHEELKSITENSTNFSEIIVESNSNFMVTFKLISTFRAWVYQILIIRKKSLKKLEPLISKIIIAKYRNCFIS